jgi:hypothetical protein
MLLRDMDLELQVAVPSGASRLTVGALLNEVLPEDEVEQGQVLASLDVRANPDLPEIYAELLDIFDQWRLGECTLRFFATDGSEIELFHPVRDHLASLPSTHRETESHCVLALQVERRYAVLARFVEWGGDKGGLLEWLQAGTLLYFMDKHGFHLPEAPPDELDRRLLPIADDLGSRDLIALSPEPREYQITVQGRQFIGDMIAEAESCIDQCDVFDDVWYELDTHAIEFGTGHGEDLRVQVYESEGMDPIRVVFLLRLYDGTLDEFADSWRRGVHSEEFFDDILRPVLNHDRVDEALVGWIIESGYAHNEEMAEVARERAFQEEVLRRIRPESQATKERDVRRGCAPPPEGG